MAKKFLEPITPPVPLTGTAIPADAWLEVHFVDVGQGDGIWIHTHDDGIDGNGRFEGEVELGKVRHGILVDLELKLVIN